MLRRVAGQVKRGVDVVVVGSGPVGSAFARALHERAPATRILMLEAGPRLTERPGVHVKNIADANVRAHAQVLSEGPDAEAVAAAAAADGAPQAGRARPGTAFVDRDNPAFPDGALSTNVGGMGAHWTCACPRPDDGERIPFIRERELNDALAAAERYLAVRRDAFPDSVEGRAILDTLRATYDDGLPPGRKVDRMPLACATADDGAPYWTGTDVVLGPLAEPGVDTFELRSETICRRLAVEGTRVVAAEIEHRPTGERERIEARTFFAAADPLRTPQLLWASGIRPPALGRYLNDHTQVICGVRLDPKLVPTADGAASVRRGEVDPIVGVFWVPYSADRHPFHGQVMHLDMSPIEIADAGDADHVVGLGWFVAKDLRAEDRVTFSEADVDAYGMPRMRIEYALTSRDRETIEAAVADQARGATALGEEVPGRGPTLVPPGSSLHYQGTTRMGDADDGESVCDSYSRVWRFENLFVGGNGVIPTSTASNPTLTSVALAVRAAEAAV
jgi:choline dehydrogenase-like flavoprotein